MKLLKLSSVHMNKDLGPGMGGGSLNPKLDINCELNEKAVAVHLHSSSYRRSSPLLIALHLEVVYKTTSSPRRL